MKAQGAPGAAHREFHYRVRWRSKQALPGAHKSSSAGAGHEFAATAPLLDYPDPRRLDMRRSVRDPFGQVFVRVYNQNSRLPVYVVVDLTASMGFGGAASKLSLVAEFLSVLALSTDRTGDPLGLVACTDRVVPELLLPATRNSAAVREMIERMCAFQPRAGGAGGLIEAAALIGQRRSLVFIISDFHFPIESTLVLLHAFAKHDVVPIVLWDSAEFSDSPRFGIARVRDSETGVERYLLLRRALRQRLRAAFAQRRKTLESVFVKSGHKPYFLLDELDCDDINRFLSER
jgi:uncharacterized protein (DUF58 family)